MLALNIFANNSKEVKDEIQVAPKGGQCQSSDGAMRRRQTIYWIATQGGKRDEKNILLLQSYYENKEGSPMNSHTRETLFWKHGFNFAGIQIGFRKEA